MATRFVRDQRGWNELTRTLTSPVARDLGRRGDRLAVLARRQAGSKTNRLRRSIRSRVLRDGRGLYAQVGSDNAIALLHHEGSRPHEIRARRTEYLRFSQGGRIRRTKRVYHPGTRPNRYLTDNLPIVVLR